LVVSLEKDKSSTSKALYFIARTEATKVSIYSGILLPKTQSKAMGSDCNKKIDVIRLKRSGEDGKVVSERDVIKMQFETGEEAKQFE
jgi:hypothetical protein